MATTKRSFTLERLQKLAVTIKDWFLGRIKNNLMTETDGYALDARQGKVLNDKIADLNSNLGIVEDDNTAAHTIEIGQYVIWKGILCEADNTIEIGTTLATSGGSKNLSIVNNGGLNDIFSMHTIRTGTYEVPSGGDPDLVHSSTGESLIKTLDIVQLFCHVYYTSASGKKFSNTSNTFVVQLPEGFHPRANLVVPCTDMVNGYTETVTIRTDGKIGFFPLNSNISNIEFSAVFIAQ